MIKLSERGIFTFVVILLLFMLLNFDPKMGQIFALMALASVSLYLIDKRISYPIEKYPKEKFKSIVYGVGGYFLFIIISTLLLQFLKFADIVGIRSTINFFSEYLSTFFSQYSPALVDSPILTFIGWGILIPITETILFFGRLFEAFVDFWKINVKINSISTWLVMMMTSAVFTLFHLSAKGIANNAALLMVFLFGMVSLYFVVIRSQLIEAITIHIIANSIAISTSFNLISINPLLIIFGIATILYIILKTKIIQKIIRRF